MRIGIIGAGLAGLSCAAVLAGHGHTPVLFDKGRGPGGRMSTRRVGSALGEIAFDHGAQYLTARDPAFIAQVERWAASGHVARWAAAGDDAWVGIPAMDSPVSALAAHLDVQWHARVDALTRESDRWVCHGQGIAAGSFDGMVVAIPAEQAASLIDAHRPDWAEQAIATPSDPCWTVMAAYRSRLAVAPDRMVDTGIIASAVRNAAKPGRTGVEAWVLQASGEWSTAHLEEQPDVVERTILEAFAAIAQVELPAPFLTRVHRWRYAKSGGLGQDAWWDVSGRLGVCGDWLIAGRVEAAWLSGRRLGQLISTS